MNYNKIPGQRDALCLEMLIAKQASEGLQLNTVKKHLLEEFDHKYDGKHY